MITKDSPLKDFYNVARQFAPCSSAVKYMKGLPQDLDMATTLQNYLDDPNNDFSYAAWALLYLYEIMDEKLRSGFISRLNNGEAAQVILKRLDSVLSQESRDQLNIMAYGRAN